MKIKENKGIIEEITPTEFMCGVGNCPAVFRTEAGSLLIIGKVVKKESWISVVGERIGHDEIIIEIPEGLISNLNM